MTIPKLGILIPIVGLIVSCAQPVPAYTHWLTAEEDKALRDRCEATGCVSVPMPLWEQIKAALKAALGVEI